MMLGGYAFEALGFGYQNIKRKVNTPWVEISVGQALNPQQWTGPTSDEVTIQGVLFPEEFGGAIAARRDHCGAIERLISVTVTDEEGAVSVTVVGDADIEAGLPLLFAEVRPGLDGVPYIIKTARSK
uniref:Phage P2 GpU family protein n=1 Tax=Rhizobium rhizogenes TaxID=359 RepID=A0A7S4ZV00_RHIRH|nr:phage tail protein [Rhizobium rhizogenes]QCO89356.1 phage P2 GpU family protein [Rhizobium rhizogenes]